VVVRATDERRLTTVMTSMPTVSEQGRAVPPLARWEHEGNDTAQSPGVDPTVDED